MCALALVIGTVALAAQNDVHLASRASGPAGAKADGPVNSGTPMCADGSQVAFSSIATNLHPDDTDPVTSVYVRDLQTHETVLVSRAQDGSSTAQPATGPSISADCRLVAFQAQGRLDPVADTDVSDDIYVRDLEAGTTTLVSRQSGPAGADGDGPSGRPVISGNGRYVAFNSSASNLSDHDDDGVSDIYVRDLETNETVFASRASGASGDGGDGNSFASALSDDGRYLAFSSVSANLNPDDTSAASSIFLRDLQTNGTALVSRASGPGGTGADQPASNPAISGDGRYVAFDTDAANLAVDEPGSDVFRREIGTSETVLVSRTSAGDPGDGASTQPSLSADGRVQTSARRRLRLGRARFRIAAGGSRTLRFRVMPRNRAVLRRLRRTRVTLTLRVVDPRGPGRRVSRRLTLRAA